MPVARWTRVARAGVAGALMLATAGCREDVAAPPSGLPLTLTASAPPAAPVPAPTITVTEMNELGTGDPIGVTYRVVAHRAPRGQYDVVLRQQHVRLGGHALLPVEIVRQTVAVP